MTVILAPNSGDALIQAYKQPGKKSAEGCITLLSKLKKFRDLGTMAASQPELTGRALAMLPLAIEKNFARLLENDVYQPFLALVSDRIHPKWEVYTEIIAAANNVIFNETGSAALQRRYEKFQYFIDGL